MEIVIRTPIIVNVCCKRNFIGFLINKSNHVNFSFSEMARIAASSSASNSANISAYNSAANKQPPHLHYVLEGLVQIFLLKLPWKQFES